MQLSGINAFFTTWPHFVQFMKPVKYICLSAQAELQLIGCFISYQIHPTILSECDKVLIKIQKT